jgi:hypothetical protein
MDVSAVAQGLLSGSRGQWSNQLRSALMGQPVRVAEKPSIARPGSVRFETNRPLTGMGHRYYNGPVVHASDQDPADVLAQRLFERGGVDHVHIHGNVATVDLSKGHDTEGIVEIIEGLFTHYTEA